MEVIQEALARHGVTATHTEIMPHFGTGQISNRMGVADPVACRETIRELAAARMPQAPLMPGARHHLERWAASRQLAVVSSNRRRVLDASLRHHELESLFNIVISGDDVEQLKPDPQGIYAALEQMKAGPETAIMIGDSDKDLLAARNAGIDSVLFYPPEHQQHYSLEKLKSCQPTYTVTSFDELATLLP
jgi:HAD superfamily hydrolase (TIGR01549 family)